jgi:hypothetical protein
MIMITLKVIFDFILWINKNDDIWESFQIILMKQAIAAVVVIRR